MMQISTLKRIIKHLLCTRREIRSYFTNQELDKIEAIVSESEQKHMAELLCVIESGWDIKSLYQHVTTQERALQWFGQTRLWDTEQNIGVLIYISFADKQIEIVADRGIARLVPNEVWQSICFEMSELFKHGEYVSGVDCGLQKIESILIEVVPRENTPYHNQYPNQMIII